MAARVTAICWQFQRNDGGHSPYQPQASTEMEAAYARGSSMYSLGHYTIDFSKQVQVRNSTGMVRGIQRTQCPLPPSSIMAYWEWDQGGGEFVPYDIEASVQIELAYMNRFTSVDLSTTPALMPYTIDLTLLEQTRHHYNTRRPVRRVPLVQPLASFLQPQTLSAVTAPPLSIHLPQATLSSINGSSLTSTSASPSAGVSHSFISPALSMMSKSSGVTSRPQSTPSTSSRSPVKGKAKQTPPTRQRKKKVTNAATSLEEPLVSVAVRASSKSLAPLKQLGELAKYVSLVSSIESDQDGPCPICLNQLTEESGYEEEAGLVMSTSHSSSLDLCQLNQCKHMLHRACLILFCKNGQDVKNGLCCPTCKKIHGVRTGDMPDGSMSVVTHSRYSLPGHEGSGVIEITYDFRPGVYKGIHYRVNGFPRVCYLPNSQKGQQVLKLLRIAWDRRLTFTIGTSVTTGASNTVVWNEIHHKTESTSNHTGHGYPDPAYLDNVLAELAAQGVDEKTS